MKQVLQELTQATFSHQHGFTTSKPHQNQCGLEVFTRNRFWSVFKPTLFPDTHQRLLYNANFVQPVSFSKCSTFGSIFKSTQF